MSSPETITITRAEYERFLAMEFELAKLKRMIFAAKSEKHIPLDPGQGSLFELGLPQKSIDNPYSVDKQTFEC